MTRDQRGLVDRATPIQSKRDRAMPTTAWHEQSKLYYDPDVIERMSDRSLQLSNEELGDLLDQCARAADGHRLNCGRN